MIGNDLCDNCGCDSGNVVTCYCPECNMSLCEMCDRIFHGRGKFRFHKRENPQDSKRTPRKTRCNEHTNVPLTLFCRDDNCNPYILIFYSFIIPFLN